MGTDQFGEFPFQSGGSGTKKTVTLTQNPQHCLGDIRIVVSEEMRSESGMIVEILSVIRVPYIGSLSPYKRDFRLSRAVDGDHPARDVLFVMFQELF
jgi:hypothetical protein